MAMTVARFLGVLLLSIGMCAAAGLLASRKVARADPADLF
jgi:ABC-type antimicrobial peptide transport system permease subunit